MKIKWLLCFFLIASISSLHAQQDSTKKSVPAHFDFIGKYSFPVGSVVPHVEVVGDSLSALSMNSEAGSSPMVHTEGDNFEITSFSGTASFKRNDSTRQVVAIHIEAMGYILDGEKDKNGSEFTWKFLLKPSLHTVASINHSKAKLESAD
ncbi:hypothetical protein [Flavihumibacter sp. ZG627]|uniref:hypothetical protein n=1 Tax=Flavihumibacter sp. ZG627 TaxID=1463156 RepID=UPI00057E52FC|nr:hypothetical protein [Flavihumibacter sp. ZG627]KIC90553.1 hypothetical protein HY58_11425 [Flavihumibacter sp. ZG627]